MKFYPTDKPLHGQLDIPGDKSISHRAVMFGSLANGTTEISHFLPGADCLSTISCFRSMGIDIETDPEHPDHVIVHGKGLHGLNALGGGLIGLIEGALLLFLAVWVLRRLGVSFETETLAEAHILRIFTTNTPLSVLSFLQ